MKKIIAVCACAACGVCGTLPAFPSLEGAEVKDRGQLPDIVESAAFDGLPQGILYPSKAAFVLPTEVKDHGEQRENADAVRDTKRQWRRVCAGRVCEDCERGKRRACGGRVRAVGVLGVCPSRCRMRGRVPGVGVPGVRAERWCGMSWKAGELGNTVNVMFGGARPLPVWPWGGAK